jgi:hypothetical protein
MRFTRSLRDYPVVVLFVASLAFASWLWRDATAAPPEEMPTAAAVSVPPATATPPDAPPMFIPPPDETHPPGVLDQNP